MQFLWYAVEVLLGKWESGGKYIDYFYMPFNSKVALSLFESFSPNRILSAIFINRLRVDGNISHSPNATLFSIAITGFELIVFISFRFVDTKVLGYTKPTYLCYTNGQIIM